MSLFDDDVAVIEKSEGVFEGAVSGNWSVNRNPNGGYLMAILAGAMAARRSLCRQSRVRYINIT